MSSARIDPWRTVRYHLEWDGLVQAGFSEVTVPDTSTDPIEYREGNEITTVRKIPGLTKYSNIVCKRGITKNMELFNWYKEIVDGNILNSRKTISILLLDELGNEAVRWDFTNAWPNKYDPPDLNATGNTIGIETLEIVHEGMRRVK
jgi:phage tail-like protein